MVGAFFVGGLKHLKNNWLFSSTSNWSTGFCYGSVGFTLGISSERLNGFPWKTQAFEEHFANL